MLARDDAAMSAPRDPILFISGAGLPAWIWDDVHQLMGWPHEVHVAARPTRGAEARLRDYAEAAIGSAPTGRFAIVAHSAGGVIGAEVARLAPERVSAFLAVTAVIPKPAGSFISAMPAPNRWVLNVAMRLAGTRPPASVIHRRLAHRLDDQAADRLVADFSPESPGLYRDKTSHHSWNGWRGYVLTAQDRELPIALQRRCAQRLGHAWGDNLDTGHLPMLEDPQALAGSIARFLDSRP
ncbi:alpha/beta hydrolase [Micromonospora yasonensis]|uniref:alpha/beta fold hydrolase n=1 Tax=Micromonospora yasonensis TaxID=1128667 RepID=UPI00223029C8|nr:alpha/beta hydrolase [Micromonospora yasonensis]MCW3839771.1 alpha/beta hydrolase [Micromonospora yasonensis]